jgi:hypothetical protein
MFLGLENQGIVREFWFSFSVDTLEKSCPSFLNLEELIVYQYWQLAFCHVKMKCFNDCIVLERAFSKLF